MTTPGENRSVYFDNDRLTKVEAIVVAFERRTGVRLNLSRVVNRAIDALYLIECPSEATDNAPESKVAA